MDWLKSRNPQAVGGIYWIEELGGWELVTESYITENEWGDCVDSYGSFG